MAKKIKNEWHLNKKDVALSGYGFSSGRRKHATRSGRANSTTGATYKLLHRPTEISIEGSIPHGNYSRNEIRLKKDELYKNLFAKLELKVAKHLSIAGR